MGIACGSSDRCRQAQPFPIQYRLPVVNCAAVVIEHHHASSFRGEENWNKTYVDHTFAFFIHEKKTECTSDILSTCSSGRLWAFISELLFNKNKGAFVGKSWKLEKSVITSDLIIRCLHIFNTAPNINLNFI